jgi:enoyl-CoA hydratase/carnithine racemase
MDAVATVTIDNPPVNALSSRVVTDLTAAVTSLDSDRAARAVVLGSTGSRAFVAGADITELRSMMSSAQVLTEHTDLTRELFVALAGLRAPLIAAVSAAAMGGGLEVLLACDVVVAEEGVLFGFPEVRLGLIPGAGGTQRLARRIGTARASDLIMRGQSFDSRRASELGIVNEVVPQGEALATAQRLGAHLARLPARAVQEAKRVIREGADVTLSQGLELEGDAFRALFATKDAAEGVAAFIEKREARFVHD